MIEQQQIEPHVTIEPSHYIVCIKNNSTKKLLANKGVNAVPLSP